MADSNLKKEQFGSPEDVTTLFAWANMRGAKYRDFSASRAKAREDIRRRVLEAAEEDRLRRMEMEQREAQEAVQRAAQEAAAQAEAIRRAEAERLAEIARQAEAERQAVLTAQEAQRRATAQRQHLPYSGQPPVSVPTTMPVSGDDAAAQALPVTVPQGAMPDVVFGSSTVPPESMREISLAVDNESAGSRFEIASAGVPPAMDDHQYRAPQMPEDVFGVQRNAWDRPRFSIQTPEMQGQAFAAQSAPGDAGVSEWSAPAMPTGMMHLGWPSQPDVSQPPAPPATAPTIPSGAAAVQEQAAQAVEDWERAVLPSWLEELPHARTAVPQEPKAPVAPVRPPATQPPAPFSQDLPWMAAFTEEPIFAASAPGYSATHPSAPIPAAPMAAFSPAQAGYGRPSVDRSDFQYSPMRAPMAEVAASAEMRRPDFSISAEMRQTMQSAGTMYSGSPASQDPLLASRDRITRNWFALKSVFHPESPKSEQPMPRVPERIPALAVFSLAGGVGKTSLLAALARALSSRAERVLLVDLSAYGLMPFFFGARDQKPGQLRTFSPPAATADAAIHLVTLDPERLKGEVAGQDALVREMQQHASGVNRILIDLPTASGAAMRRVLRFNPTVLVPLTPDMNSVVSVGAIESFFQNQMAQSNAQSQPLYVLNHFDPSQQLHVDVRNLLREQIGNRLLPFVLRSSPAVSEALAEGMTVMDYAPGTVIAEDYLNLANWIRSLSAPAGLVHRGARWSEQ